MLCAGGVNGVASERRDVSVSYVHSHSTRDLNGYDDFFGNFRDPIIRANQNSLSPTDVPHRWIVRGSLGLPAQWTFSPLYEWRTGFPWSAVNEFQDFVGPRNETGRLPRVSTFDFTLTRPFQFSTALTEKLLAYSLGRGLEPYDVPAVRKIVNSTAPDYKFQALILGVVKSTPFQMRKAGGAAPATPATTSARSNAN